MSLYHQILGISESAKPNEIKKAYRALALKFHPDINKDPEAAEQFIKITEAYEFLIGEGKAKKQHQSQPEYKDIAREKAKAYGRIKYEEFQRKCDAFDATPMHKILWPAWVNFLFIAIALFFITDSLLPKSTITCTVGFPDKQYYEACGKKLNLSEKHQINGNPLGKTVVLRVTPVVGYVHSYNIEGDEANDFTLMQNSETEYIAIMYLLLLLAVLALLNKTKKMENKLLIKIGMCIALAAYGLVYFMWLFN